MPAIFEALPGLETPVVAIGKGLADMWGDTAAHGRPAPASEDARATQVNFVLHLGFSTTSEDGVAQFQTAVRFSRRYPCRVVVLCPVQDEPATGDMRAKVYGECTLGKSKDDKRCCEFVILSYPQDQRLFLENQVSVCLSTDLPLYYWAHRFSTSKRLAQYQYLLTRAKRVLIDSAIAPPDALTYPWPRPEAVRDLVYARLLPIRQSLGQFLSRYPMDVLCQGLQTVSVAYGTALAAEGRVLLGWLKDRFAQCERNRAAFALEAKADLPASGLSVAFDYADKKRFSWRADLAKVQALLESDFGSGRTTLATTAALLAPEVALSEAMFF